MVSSLMIDWHDSKSHNGIWAESPNAIYSSRQWHSMEEGVNRLAFTRIERYGVGATSP